MSFFKDFKADFTQAMNELMPDGNEMYEDDTESEDEVVETPKKEKPKKRKFRHPKIPKMWILLRKICLTRLTIC